MKRDLRRWLIAVALINVNTCVARSEAVLSTAARNIEYSRPLGKYLLNAAQQNAMLRRPDVSKAVNGYLLGASAEKSYKPSEVINVRVAFMNTGANAVAEKGYQYNPARTYDFSVTTPQGNLAPLTLYGQKELGLYARMGEVSHDYYTFKTGTEIIDNIPINRYYDMTLPGYYTIVVSKRVNLARGWRKARTERDPIPEDEKPSIVYAKEITLTVE